jgi:wyosine [tRNA(Phe)-imidazoG37] synthetase (radical SAM superfamily)
VIEKVNRLRTSGERVDYLTFVPTGEPTLDLNLRHEILQLKSLGIPIAVITNASLLWRDDVRDDLMEADLVSVKVDSVDEALWKRINRPHGDLILRKVLGGIEDFAASYSGRLISETMLIKGFRNYSNSIASFLSNLSRLDMAYLSTVTRPPSEKWVELAEHADLMEALGAFSERLGDQRVKALVEHEGGRFAPLGKAEEELLGIMAVHPMREDVLRSYLIETGEDWGLVDRLLCDGKIVEVKYCGQSYFKRKTPF